LCEFEEIEISSKAAEVTVNNNEENSQDFFLDFLKRLFSGFLQEFGLRKILFSGAKITEYI
jgi:hypothetical protein